MLVDLQYKLNAAKRFKSSSKHVFSCWVFVILLMYLGHEWEMIINNTNTHLREKKVKVFKNQIS